MSAWDGDDYQRRFDELAAGGVDVHGEASFVAALGPTAVLDAGCGTGRVTAALVERLPRGKVIAVDGSPAMVEEARARLPEGVDVHVADLLELRLPDPVDAVLSTATFHWIRDHERLFTRLHDVLRPGGRLVAQCGGAGNIATVREAIARASRRVPFGPALENWEGPWNFASPEETQARLERVGFTGVRCWRTEWPVPVERDEREYFATVMLGSHLERLDPEDRDGFVDAVLAEMPAPIVVDYVRLNIDARRPD